MFGKRLTIGVLASTANRLGGGLRQWGRVGLDLLAPPQCAFCDEELAGADDGLLLCGGCRQALAPSAGPICGRCGVGVSAQSDRGELCPRCRETRLRFDTVVSQGVYRSELREAVLRMKRPAGDRLSSALGRWYSRCRATRLSALRPDLVVPVPMYWRRRLARGANSPEILASRLAGDLGVPMAARMLVRSRNTLPQADLPPRQRFQNVRGAFRLRAGYDLAGARVVLVDDILTTGATCSEAAKVCKRAGAALVVAAVIARAEGPAFG